MDETPGREPAEARPRPPRPGVPRPAPPAGAGSAAGRPGPGASSGSDADAATFGRVAEDGTVYVRSRDGSEREVGQWPDADPAEALALFTGRFDGLAVEVQLLAQRVGEQALPPDEAEARIAQVRAEVENAHAVGDLEALAERLDALAPVVAEQRQQRRADRAARMDEARAVKHQLVEEAERLAGSTDWRAGADRLRELMDQWKAQARIDKPTDDELWRRFSTARSTYTRRRRQHFAELHEQHDQARAVKAKLAAEAETLADSTEWGPTAGRFRDLMQQWKAAGPAGRRDEETLWRRFRTAQDTFFQAREAATARTEEEFAANAAVKREILAAAEALLPVTDVAAARPAFRTLAERWDAAGKVPRGQLQELEGRMRAVENAVRAAEEERWQRSNPEARARAEATVGQLESSLADLRARLDKAEAAGDDKRRRSLTEDIEARESWLEQARKALADFTP